MRLCCPRHASDTQPYMPTYGHDKRDYLHVEPAVLLERLTHARPAESAIQKMLREHKAAQ